MPSGDGNEIVIEDEISIEDEIYQHGIRPQLTDVREKQFKPWHKPRKHYLRVFQWCEQIASLIKDLRLKSGETLRYLGMPGEDLLDVRTLRGVCDRNKLKLRYLGFDSTADTGGQYELNLSTHEVAALGFMDPFSKVLKDRVEHIAKDNSITQSQFESSAPYDIINLDLCDSIATASGPGSYYDALLKICDLQLKAGRSKPWLLFMATRAIRTQIDGTSKIALLQCVQANMKGSAVFADRVNRDLALDLQDIMNEIAGTDTLEHNKLVKAFALGLSKWLLKAALSGHPNVKVALLPSYSYRIEVAEPDMLSLAFRFEPVIQNRVDHTGLARTTSSMLQPSEETLAIAIAEAVAKVVDVDQLLANDTGLMEKVTSQSAAIMEGARYRRDKYLEWVRTTPTFGDGAREDGGRVVPNGLGQGAARGVDE